MQPAKYFEEVRQMGRVLSRFGMVLALSVLVCAVLFFVVMPAVSMFIDTADVYGDNVALTSNGPPAFIASVIGVLVVLAFRTLRRHSHGHSV